MSVAHLENRTEHLRSRSRDSTFSLRTALLLAQVLRGPVVVVPDLTIVYCSCPDVCCQSVLGGKWNSVVSVLEAVLRNRGGFLPGPIQVRACDAACALCPCATARRVRADRLTWRERVTTHGTRCLHLFTLPGCSPALQQGLQDWELCRVGLSCHFALDFIYAFTE